MQKYKTDFIGFLQISGLLLLFGICAGLQHPFYLGVSELNYNSKSKSLEISIKLFTDDLEKCLTSHFKKPINLYGQEQSAYLDSTVKTYIDQHFKILHQGRKLSFHYVGYEKSDEATWTYFEVPLSEEPQALQIYNSLLYDCIFEQSNILHIKIGAQSSSHKLNYPDSSYLWKFSEN